MLAPGATPEIRKLGSAANHDMHVLAPHAAGLDYHGAGWVPLGSRNSSTRTATHYNHL